MIFSNTLSGQRCEILGIDGEYLTIDHPRGQKRILSSNVQRFEHPKILFKVGDRVGKTYKLGWWGRVHSLPKNGRVEILWDYDKHPTMEVIEAITKREESTQSKAPKSQSKKLSKRVSLASWCNIQTKEHCMILGEPNENEVILDPHKLDEPLSKNKPLRLRGLKGVYEVENIYGCDCDPSGQEWSVNCQVKSSNGCLKIWIVRITVQAD